MRKAAVFVFFMSVFVAPVEAQVREAGYFNASTMGDWWYDSEYWVATGSLRFVPRHSTTDYPNCIISALRNPYSRAQLERMFAGVTPEVVIEGWRQNHIELFEVVSVDTYPLNGIYPMVVNFSRMDDGGLSLVEYHIGGANGVVSVRCRENYRDPIQTVRYFDAFVANLQIEMPPPN